MALRPHADILVILDVSQDVMYQYSHCDCDTVADTHQTVVVFSVIFSGAHAAAWSQLVELCGRPAGEVDRSVSQ